MKRISIDVADDQKAEKLIDLLSVVDFVDKIQITGQRQSVADDLFHDPRQPLMEQEVAAFEELHADLVKQYLGEYVAIYQGRVIDHDRNESELIDRIEATYPTAVVLVRCVQEQLPPPLYIRSPRLELE
jgi:hypothetical protein